MLHDLLSAQVASAGIALAACAASWFVGRIAARWGRGSALFVRVLACGPVLLAATGYYHFGLLGRHGVPIELLYLPAAVYPLIASALW